MSEKMQSRRKDEYRKASPTVNMRSRQHRAADEVSRREPYSVSRGAARAESSPPLTRLRNCYSPNTLDVSGRGGLVRDRTSGSMERRDSYGWHEKARSRSPAAHEKMLKRPHFDDEGVVNRAYDYAELISFNESKNSRARTVYMHNHGTSRMSKERDYVENRGTSIDRHGNVGQKLVPAEDFAIRGSHRLPHSSGSGLDYAEAGGQLPLSSRDIEGKYDHEKLQRREGIPSNKLIMDSYKEEKPTFHSQNVAYSMTAESHPREFRSHSQLKDFAGTSSGIPRSEFLGSYQDDASLAVSEDYSRSSGKLPESGRYKYEQRPFIDSRRDHEATRRNVPLFQEGAISPRRAEYEDYLYRKPRAIVSENHGYPSDEITTMTPSQSRVSYEHASSDFGNRDMTKPNMLHHVIDRTDNTDDSCGNSRKDIIWDGYTWRRQLSSDYTDANRPYASTQGGEHLGAERAHIHFERRLPQDYEMSHLDASRNFQVTSLRSDYSFGREDDSEFHKERVKDYPANYEAGQTRLGARTQRMREELDMYPDRFLKRKYLMDEDVIRPSSKSYISRKASANGNFGGPYGSEDLNDEDIIGLRASSTKEYANNEYRKVGGRTYDEQDHREVLVSDDWYSSQVSPVHPPRAPVRFYKNSGKYFKGHPGPGSFSWNTSHQYDRSSSLHKQNKTWKRYDDYDEDINANDDDMTEDLVNHAEAELSEDSEEFKQLVHEAFLRYTKRLNLNHSVRRRYKEQGQAGSLFCIVCGRSYSKEFMDTQRLVTHAFMSHKVGLRAQHLGLHKAICVLLGWDTVAPPETITWVPQILPEAEALAQKEDLVLWPPIVVIHNSSMANNNPQEQKVIPIEGVQAFLRGRGFIRGKITVCLGRPADQSVMVVKFLGTFSGLGMAERLHRYFAEHKRGRVEFQRISNNDKIGIEEIQEQGGKLEEQLLYGYMAIAEDLDKLDFNNRKWSLIKSKKEIQELANDPVKVDDSR